MLYAIAAPWGVALAYSIATARVLYGDGAWFVLTHLLTPYRFNDYDFQRTFASVISQAPFLFGQRLGLDSVAAYIALYAFGIFVLPAVTILALHGSAPILRGLVLPTIAIALLRSYEGMLLVGPFLAMWATISAVQHEGRLESIGLVFAAIGSDSSA